MTEEERQQQQGTGELGGQTQEQLAGLLRDTIKENKTLQNKNSKLETKYVELFKQHKALKKDHSLFLAFLNRYFTNHPDDLRPPLPEAPAGQYEMQDLEKMAEGKDGLHRARVQQLEKALEQSQKELAQLQAQRKSELEAALKKKQNDVGKQYEQKLKEAKESSSKELAASLREAQSLRRTNKQQAEEIAQLKSSLEQKLNELSRISKEKLKMEHHLNNIRKKQIAQELSPEEDSRQQKLMNERNEFLSLRQQLETLMIKRDQMKGQLTEKQAQLEAQRSRSESLEKELQLLRDAKNELDQKYELVRQCTMEQLQNLILGHMAQNDPPSQPPPPKQQQLPAEKKAEKNQQLVKAQQGKGEEAKGEHSEQIQHEYLKNVLQRYIKAETSGSFDQALMLLEILGTILRLDGQSSQALESYKNKRKQWWYIKY